MTRSQAWDDHPEHVITVEPQPGTVSVRLGETLLAESRDALLLREGRYPPVVYVPRADVHMDRFQAESHRTHCPFKGDASYWSVIGGGERGDKAAWSYEDPFDQMESIRSHFAFYADRIEIETSD